MHGAPLILLNDSARMARDAAPRGHVRDLSAASEAPTVAGEPEAELTVRNSASSAERGWDADCRVVLSGASSSRWTRDWSTAVVS